MRLLAGLLAGQEGRFELTGDESLRSAADGADRRAARAMGARIETTDGTAPLDDRGRRRCSRDRLRAAGRERPGEVVRAAGRPVRRTAGRPWSSRCRRAITPSCCCRPPGRAVRRRGSGSRSLRPSGSAAGRVQVPGDFSSAAPFLVAATLLSGSELTIHGVGPESDAAPASSTCSRTWEPVSTVFNRRRARPRAGRRPGGRPRRARRDVRQAGARCPRLVDELPLFALAARCARGESVVRGAGELRAKETDRIETVTDCPSALGIHIAASDDGFGVRGVPTRPKGGGVDSHGDHRIAMLGGIAGVVSREGVRVGGAEAVDMSFPGFFDLLDQVARRPSIYVVRLLHA